MNAEVKAMWLEALRSGVYKQGRGQLRTIGEQDSFCCLGVLCDLHSETAETPDSEWQGDEYCGEAYTLPPHVQDWAGLTEKNPKVQGHSLATWNDGQQAPEQGEEVTPLDFPSIADLIERGL
jgi:hypothetical protein